MRAQKIEPERVVTLRHGPGFASRASRSSRAVRAASLRT